MMKPGPHATLLASMSAAMALLSAAPALAAAESPPHDVYEFAPSPEDDRAAITARNDAARMHAAHVAERQRKEGAAGAGSGDARSPMRADGEDGTGAVCRIPSSNFTDDACRAQSDKAVGAARSPYDGPGFRRSTGPKAYLLPLDEAELPGR